jgi:hypothetical protein
MSSPLLTKILASVFGVVFLAAASAPADAAKLRKHTVRTAHVQTQYRGLDKFPAGPIYAGPTYLGDDPDPFIRSQIARDVNAVYGGNN